MAAKILVKDDESQTRTVLWNTKQVQSYFHEICGSHKGDSCFYQKDMFTPEQIYDNCYSCCQIGIEHYLKHFGMSNT